MRLNLTKGMIGLEKRPGYYYDIEGRLVLTSQKVGGDLAEKGRLMWIYYQCSACFYLQKRETWEMIDRRSGGLLPQFV